MSPNEYQTRAMRTRNKALTPDQGLMNAALGMCGESGEVADLLKKYCYQGHALDKMHVIKELGDILWYVALACESLNIPIEEVMKMNIDKLVARYPEGFDKERSINRKADDV